MHDRSSTLAVVAFDLSMPHLVQDHQVVGGTDWILRIFATASRSIVRAIAFPLSLKIGVAWSRDNPIILLALE